MKKYGKLIGVLLLLLVLSGCKKSENPMEESKIEPKNLDPWAYVQDTGVSHNTALVSLASSASELATVAGVVGIVFSLIYMAVRACFMKSASAREEIRREALMKGIVAIMLFSIPFWLGLLKEFAELFV